ncbi:2-dehydro-3-deoxy-6-phosphogalactonate aldolase, partial [Escherichia coli]|nr:2-dehydro-3-deoxy-6-phosphogalactonate aldolase [Escherichia coli]
AGQPLARTRQQAQRFIAACGD